MLLKKWLTTAVLLLAIQARSYCWGFYAHQRINYLAVFLLPPEMMVLYKQHIGFLSEHAVDPDKRRYAIPQEAPRHFIDIDCYGEAPFSNLPHKWADALARYKEDTLTDRGIVPWWVQVMQQRLTDAFKSKNQAQILKLSAEIGHYIADAHVPLHASSNHNGQYSGQKGIHAFWESRVPELLAETRWNFFIGKATYIPDTGDFIWKRVLESAAAADTVLRCEKELTANFPADEKYAFEARNELIIRQYSTRFSIAYDELLKGMIERRMRQSIYAVASFWYTAWVNAGQPDLKDLSDKDFTPAAIKEFSDLNLSWKTGNAAGKVCE
jgi:hypothetical protein